MKRRTLLGLLLGTAAAGLTGCGGWYMRGTRRTALSGRRLYLMMSNVSYLRPYFLQQLSYNNVSTVSSREQADAVIEVSNESFDRRVLSVDPDTGKVREIELGLQVEVTVRAPDGSLIAAPDTLQWVQDFVFDEASLLGTEEVEQTVRYELAKNAAQALVFKLETVDFEQRRVRNAVREQGRG